MAGIRMAFKNSYIKKISFKKLKINEEINSTSKPPVT